MDIEDKCTEIGRASEPPLSPMSSLIESFQRLKISEDTPPLRSNGATAATRRKREPKPYIAGQNLQPQLYIRNKMLEIVPGLVRHDVVTFFANHFEKALDSWISILTKTTIPDNVTSSDPRVLNSFQLLDKARTDGDKMLSRLAYIRLAYVFESLQEIVASDRRNGQLPAPRRGCGNASIATDIYIKAQQAVTSRNEVKERKRIARRWRTLAGPSPIFVIIYSGAAERLVYVLFFVIYSFILTILKQQIVDTNY
jgi:hypothetical protein